MAGRPWRAPASRGNRHGGLRDDRGGRRVSSVPPTVCPGRPPQPAGAFFLGPALRCARASAADPRAAMRASRRSHVATYFNHNPAG